MQNHESATRICRQRQTKGMTILVDCSEESQRLAMTVTEIMTVPWRSDSSIKHAAIAEKKGE